MSTDVRHDASEPRPARPPSPYGPDFDVAALATSEQCLEAMAALDGEKAHIEAQLSAAIARFHAEGERGDPTWFAKAKNAQRLKSRLRQRVQERLGALRRKEREERATGRNAWMWEFYYEAQRALPREVLGPIEVAVESRMRERGQ
jgi:hypothetical protein